MRPVGLRSHTRVCTCSEQNGPIAGETVECICSHLVYTQARKLQIAMQLKLQDSGMQLSLHLFLFLQSLL